MMTRTGTLALLVTVALAGYGCAGRTDTTTTTAGTSGAGGTSTGATAGQSAGATGTGATAGQSAGATGTSAAASTAGGSSSAADQDFVRFAAESSMAEIELGRLAQERAANADVRAFAQQMVTDHTKTTQDLKQAVGGQVQVPAALDAKHQAIRDRLAQHTGAAFDREYMAVMVDSHQEAVTRFQQQGASASMPAVRAFAQANLPALQQHLQMAQALRANVQ